jgi:hypothetical protein
MSIGVVLERLQGVKVAGEHQWKALCPAHEDKNASLSVKMTAEGKVLLYCHAGCKVEAICKAAGLEVKDLFSESTAKAAKPRTPARAKSKTIPYEVREGSGTLVAIHERHESDHGKRFVWKRPDGELGLGGLRLRDLPLYGTDRLGKVPPGDPIIISEGEKACESLWERDISAVATVTGSGETPGPEVLRCLLSFRVYLWPDNDQPGRKHMEHVGSALNRLGHRDVWVIRWAEAPEKGDGADFTGDVAGLMQAAAKFAPPEAIKTGALLADLSAFIGQFVVVDDDALVVLSLWVAHTWVLDAFDTTPYLHLRSAEKRSGKTRLLEVLNLLAKDAWMTSSATAPAVMRKVEADQPTLLLDEADRTFAGDPDSAQRIHAMLNSGYVRSGKATVCEKLDGDFSVRDFATFCPKAFAGIGTLPDTLADRCLTIVMRRRKATEKVGRFRIRLVGGEATALAERLDAWAPGVVDDLRRAEARLPEALTDRQQDVVEPLLAIADLAGGEWPDRARRAVLGLCGEESEDSLGVQLLRDVRTVFEDLDRLSTEALVERLVSLPESPWGTLHKGRPLDQRGLARRLAAFGIRSRNVRLENDRIAKGYHREQFEDAWIRYVPTFPDLANATPLQLNADGLFRGFPSATRPDHVADEKRRNPLIDGLCSGVADEAPGEARETEIPGVEDEPQMASERQTDALSTPEQQERCFCCGGTDFWRVRDSGNSLRCMVCYPPAPGLDVETVSRIIREPGSDVTESVI